MEGQLKFPSLQYLYQYQILICMLSTVGCLTKARGLDPHFDSSHFSYTFIDEAAAIHETVTMMPIAGACLTLGFTGFTCLTSISHLFEMLVEWVELFE